MSFCIFAVLPLIEVLIFLFIFQLFVQTPQITDLEWLEPMPVEFFEICWKLIFILNLSVVFDVFHFYFSVTEKYCTNNLSLNTYGNVPSWDEFQISATTLLLDQIK